MTDEGADGATPEASRRKFRTVFEHANDAIFIVDVENDDIVDCNPAAEDLVKYSREELAEMPASDLHPHNLEEFMDFAEGVLEEGSGWTDEVTCYRKGGEIIPAHMSASVIELDGRPHLVNHIRETTEREEREWFEALIEHSSDLITVLTPDGSVRYQSPSIDHVLGYTPEEVQDEGFLEYVHVDDRPLVAEAIEQVEYTDTRVSERVEYRFRRAGGSWAWLESIVSHRSDSVVVGYVVNSRDVTPRKESRQQAAVLNRTLRHNLRNELNVVLGVAEDLVTHPDGAVQTHGERVLGSVGDLQDLASYTGVLADILESHPTQLHQQDVTVLVDTAVATLRERHADVTFDLDLPEARPVSAAPKLDVALEHVLSNAVEHNDADDPRVEVSVRSVPDRGLIEVTVADNGPGIPANERQVLSEGRETPLQHGTGLGLWIVNWIVTRSGGRIEYEERDPRGSRVRLLIPAPE